MCAIMCVKIVLVSKKKNNDVCVSYEAEMLHI